MIKIRIVNKEGIKALSRKLLNLLRDKNSEVYVDNVVKFGIAHEPGGDQPSRAN